MDRTEVTATNGAGLPVKLVDENNEVLFVGDIVENHAGDIHRILEVQDSAASDCVITNWGTYPAAKVNCRWAPK